MILNRNCLNLQYLSLAHCYRFTDKGFMYLATGKGCHKLVHLNLSGCTQVSWYALCSVVCILTPQRTLFYLSWAFSPAWINPVTPLCFHVLEFLPVSWWLFSLRAQSKWTTWRRGRVQGSQEEGWVYTISSGPPTLHNITHMHWNIIRTFPLGMWISLAPDVSLYGAVTMCAAGKTARKKCIHTHAYFPLSPPRWL